MTAARTNLTIEQKATFRKVLTYRDKQQRLVNLTGYGAKMQIRDDANNLLSDMNVANGKIIIDGASGSITLLLSAIETSAMTFLSANYDLKLVAPNGDEIRLLEGKVLLSLGQTQ